jgi:hypothetical protein
MIEVLIQLLIELWDQVLCRNGMPFIIWTLSMQVHIWEIVIKQAVLLKPK